MFCSCFELFILVGLQQTMGLLLPSLMSIFTGSIVFALVVFSIAQSFLFGHIQSYFLKNEVILSSFLGYKNVPIDYYPTYQSLAK